MREKQSYGLQQETSFITSLLILNSVSNVFGLTCYHCQIRPSATNKLVENRLCSQFNETSYFEVDCPMSTYCLKRTFSLQLLKEKNITITTRGCAPQTLVYQYYNGKEWIWQKELISDTYKEGCTYNEYSSQIKLSPEQFCYCQGNLCNGQPKKDNTSHADIMTVIFMFNAMKYVRSVL